MFDINKKVLESRCPISSCKKLFEAGITDIAPMIVVEPIAHSKIGEAIWVCVEHWIDSTDNSLEDDDDINKVGIQFEADSLASKVSSPLFSRKRATPTARKNILAKKPRISLPTESIADIFDSDSMDTTKM